LKKCEQIAGYQYNGHLKIEVTLQLTCFIRFGASNVCCFFFVLGRTWRKWDGWTSGKLFARNAVMDEGTGKFGVYDSEDRAGCIPKTDDSFAFCSVARLKFYKNSSMMDQLSVIQGGESYR